MNKQNNKKNMKIGSKFIPETNIVGKLYEELVKNYGYNPSQIKLDQTVTIRKMDDHKIDMIINNEKTNSLETIIEIKSSLHLLGDYDIGYFSELFAESHAKYAMLYNGFEKICFKKVLGHEIIEVNDIPSHKNNKTKKPTDVKLKFWKIFEHLRGTVPSSNYLEILSSLLYLKYFDEKNEPDKFFEGLTDDPLTNEEMMYAKFKNENLKSYNFLDSFKEIKPKFLSLLLFEMQNFTIKDLDPEEIAYHFFKSQENFSKISESSSLPKNVLKFMYLFLTHRDHDEKMENLNLLSFNGSNRTCFDLIDFSADHMNLTGKKLRDYCEQKITIIDNTRSKISSLNILLKIKGIHPKLLEESMTNGLKNKFQLILATPPLSMNASSVRNFLKHARENKDMDDANESDLFEKLFQQLEPNGLLSIIVSPSFLFSNKFHKTREFLIENMTIRGIIRLPRNTLSTTSMRPVVLFLENSTPSQKYDVFISNLDFMLTRDRQINSKILHDVFNKFIEFQTAEKIPAQNDSSFYVSSSQLTDGDWRFDWNKIQWSLQKFDTSKYIQFVKSGVLFDGGELIAGKDIRELHHTHGVEIPRILISDIEDLGKIKSKLNRKTYVKNTNKSNLSFVQENDILLSIKGTIGKSAIVTKQHSGAHVGSQFVIIRPKSHKDVENIFNNLNSEIVQEQLKKLTTGNFIPFIRRKDLEKIYFLPLDDHKINKIKKLRKEIDEFTQRLEKSEQELKELLKEKNES